jgi:hypothetical protein
MPPNTQRSIIVLDEQPDFFRYEHALDNPDTNRKDLYTDCITDFDTCPVCENSESKPYYAMYLTVIDLEPYEIKKGDRKGEVVEWSRKLFVVKSGMQRQWTREFERNGSLRGKVFTVFRDDDKSPVSGNQIEEDMEEDPYSEDDLAEFERSWTDRERKEHHEECDVAFDYDEIMPEMSKDQLEAVVGGGRPTPGSRQAEDDELSDRSTRRARRGSSRRDRDDEPTTERADDDGGWDNPDDSDPPFEPDDDKSEKEEKEEEPRRGRGRRARQEAKEPEPEPSRRRGTRSRR